MCLRNNSDTWSFNIKLAVEVIKTYTGTVKLQIAVVNLKKLASLIVKHFYACLIQSSLKQIYARLIQSLKHIYTRLIQSLKHIYARLIQSLKQNLRSSYTIIHRFAHTTANFKKLIQNHNRTNYSFHVLKQMIYYT